MVYIRRVASQPRADWQQQAEDLDYTYYKNADGSSAWREDVRYELDQSALSVIRKAAGTLHALCLKVVDEVVSSPGGLNEFHIPPSVHDVVRESWLRCDPFLIGRFDFAWCGGIPKLIEYNADTPATLPESTQMQTVWHQQRCLADSHAPLDAHALVERFRALLRAGRIASVIHVVPYPDNTEDATHARYYQRWLQQAGIQAVLCELKDLEVTTHGHFLHRGRIVRTMLRMYPWELMFRDPGAKYLRACECSFLNPPWTALLSNKALLPALWRRYSGHPNLLPAGYSVSDVAGDIYVEKPVHARGGENVRVLRGKQELCVEQGTYGSYPRVYQAFADHQIDGVTTSVGAWMVGNQFAGLTLRESKDLIVRHTSAIVPHSIKKESLKEKVRKFFYIK